MIRNADHLALFIADALKSRDHCRIYQDALDQCWFHPGPAGRSIQREQIAAFAGRNRWIVQVHVPGGYGIVADFRPAPADGSHLEKGT